METLLQKTREINKLLHKSGHVGYSDLVNIMKDELVANVYIASNEGNVRA